MGGRAGDDRGAKRANYFRLKAVGVMRVGAFFFLWCEQGKMLNSSIMICIEYSCTASARCNLMFFFFSHCYL